MHAYALVLDPSVIILCIFMLNIPNLIKLDKISYETFFKQFLHTYKPTLVETE